MFFDPFFIMETAKVDDNYQPEDNHWGFFEWFLIFKIFG
jgi:hypothetical protein